MSKFVLNVHNNEGTIYVYSNEVYKDPMNSVFADQPQHPSGSQNDSSFHTAQARFPYTQQFSPAQNKSASNISQASNGAQQSTSMNYPQQYSTQNGTSFWPFNPPYVPPLNLPNTLFNPKFDKFELPKIEEEVKDTNEQEAADVITKKDDFEAEIKNQNLPKAQNKKGKKT